MNYPAQPAPDQRGSGLHSPPAADAAPSHDGPGVPHNGDWPQYGARQQNGHLQQDSDGQPEPPGGFQPVRDEELQPARPHTWPTGQQGWPSAADQPTGPPARQRAPGAVSAWPLPDSPLTGPHVRGPEPTESADVPGPSRQPEPVRFPPDAGSGADGAARDDMTVDEAAQRWAMLGYLGWPFLSFLPALAVYLCMQRSPFVRRHAAQALNLSITVLLYDFSALIFGGLMSLDSVRVALLIVTPMVAGLWLAGLVYIVLAAISAGRGEYRAIPGWLCAAILR
jgi:uncharacterized Tic20 family protein